MANTFWDPDLDGDFNVDFSVVEGYDDDSESIKFDLYVMTREIKQINDSLKTVGLLPKAQQKQWVKDNRAQLQNMMDGMVKEVMEMFDGIEFDKETLADSVSCMTELRAMMTHLHSIIGDSKQLRG